MQPIRLSHRAVAASALAVVLAGGSFAPAVADGGKGGKGEKGDKGRSEQAKGKSESRGSSRSAKDEPARSGERGESGSRPQGGGQGGGQGGSAAAQGGGAGEDPAGNNGTFKVDGPAYDDGLGNEPHVACEFRLKFYGFDDDQTGDITIAGHAPSGSGTVSSRSDVLISDDAAGGGPNDVDEVVTYSLSDLDLDGLTPHPKQGYHLKVTLETDAPGGVKHKVFWLEPCATEPAAAPTTGAGDGTGGDDTEVGGDDTEVGGVGTGVGGTDVGATGDVDAQVLGTRFSRTDATGDRSGADVLGTSLTRGPLAFTGAFTEALLALGASLIAAGTGFVLWARKPRGRHAL